MDDKIKRLFRTVPHGSKEFRDAHYNDLYDFYNDYDDERPQTASKPQHYGRMVESSRKGEFTVYDQIARYSRPPSAADSQVEGCTGISRQASPKVLNPLQALALWRPPSAEKNSYSERSATPVDVSRPVTATSAAGYCSRGSMLDCSSQGTRALSPLSLRQDEPIPDLQLRELENHVHALLEESAAASLVGNHIDALEKAKDAGKKERLLSRRKEQLGVAETNIDLTFAVCFNLGYQYQMYKLHSEALCTYSQIVKNKQFTQGGRTRVNMGCIYYEQGNFSLAIKMYRMALDETPNAYRETRFRIVRNIGIALMQLGQYQDAVQSFEAVMGIKYDHQSCYNLIVCYYIIGNREKMKSCFTKLLLVRHYDFDADDDIRDNLASYSQNDELQEELQSRQIKADKYTLNAARLIAPNVCNTLEEGYNWVIDILKDQEYATLAQEMEMDKSVQQLYMHGVDQAVCFLKQIEKRECSIKARASINLSFIYLLEQDVEKAQIYAKLAVDRGSHKASALVNQGNTFFLKGDIGEAVALYEAATEVDANCIQAIYNIGLANKRLGLLAESLDSFMNLAKILPNNIEVIYQVGHIHKMMNNVQQAIRWLEVVIARVMHDAETLTMLGSLYVQSNDEAKALHYYSEAFQVYPIKLDVINWLSAFFLRNKLYEKAIRILDVASKIQPDEVKWKFMVASCYKQIGRYTIALLKYKDILSSHPNNIECLRHLLHMCTSLGQREAAHDFEDRLKKAERKGSPFRRESESFEERNISYISSSNATQSSITMFCSTASMKRSRLHEKCEIGDDLLPM